VGRSSNLKDPLRRGEVMALQSKREVHPKLADKVSASRLLSKPITKYELPNQRIEHATAY